MVNRAQRRMEKALRRKEIVRTGPVAESADDGAVVILHGAEHASKLPPYKASAALLDVAEFLPSDGDADYATFHKKMMFTMLAWNLSLLPIDERKRQMRAFFEKLLPAPEKDWESAPISELEKAWPSFAEMIELIIRRKMKLFPRDRRLMSDLQVLEKPDGYRVNVRSELGVD